ncbi:pilus assembly protein TadG-related protein [Stakelama saccharophila]|uniref:Pilus assembly protein TadG-related protein n=1 Tax=Stakelama saccharophila TaxID=3075605 RepID=A0ABZ0BBF3_9SPHN|nr:pilus assembly protein TadG-related protein [Stakelama sp. W311]WNO54756.1 pilus assembly protein TadG-related protein [Stakelama sp. W311]
MTPPATLRRDRRGTTAILVAGAMPMILGAAALAIDLGSARLDSRKLQGMADAAALAATADPANARPVARQIVAKTDWAQAVTVRTVRGSYSRSVDLAPAERFQPSASGDAVRVSLSSRSPTFFARIFGADSIPIARTATATRTKMASFSIGSRLLALDGGLLNAYLGALTGSDISLSVMDYEALAGADIDLLSYVDALHSSVDAQALTFDQVLDSDIDVAQAIRVLASTTPDAGARSAMLRLAAGTSAGTIRLADLIDLGPLGGQDGGGTGLVKVNAMQLATALLQLSSGERQVALDVGAGIPGLAETRVMLGIGERPDSAPWIAVTDNGEPVIRTAQARIYLETKIADVALPGLSSLVAVDLPVFVELASGEARLNAITCGDGGRGVTLDGRPGLGKAAIARIDEQRFDDFTTPVPLHEARLVHALVVDVDGRAVVDLGADERWQQVRFSADDIDEGAVRTISSGHAVGGLTTSLASNLDVTVRALFLRLPAGPVAGAIGSRLDLLAPALDGVLNLATGAVGVRYGQADLRVTGMRCGEPELVG